MDVSSHSAPPPPPPPWLDRSTMTTTSLWTGESSKGVLVVLDVGMCQQCNGKRVSPAQLCQLNTYDFVAAQELENGCFHHVGAFSCTVVGLFLLLLLLLLFSVEMDHVVSQRLSSHTWTVQDLDNSGTLTLPEFEAFFKGIKNLAGDEIASVRCVLVFHHTRRVHVMCFNHDAYVPSVHVTDPLVAHRVFLITSWAP